MPKTEIKIPATPAPIQDNPEQLSIMNKAKQVLPWALVAIVLVAAGLFSAVQYKNSKNLKNQVAQLKANPQQVAQDQTKELIDQIGKLIVLPDNEQPTVATVTDLAPLKDQPFFADAQIGDKVLIYTQAKKAILYRPSTNKIVEVAPVNIGNNTGQAASPQVAGDSTTTNTTTTKKTKPKTTTPDSTTTP